MSSLKFQSRPIRRRWIIPPSGWRSAGGMQEDGNVKRRRTGTRDRGWGEEGGGFNGRGREKMRDWNRKGVKEGEVDKERLKERWKGGNRERDKDFRIERETKIARDSRSDTVTPDQKKSQSVHKQMRWLQVCRDNVVCRTLLFNF